MAYYLDIFSPATYEAFGKSDRSITGFRMGQKKTAQRIGPGDKLICYMTKLSRWVGILEVLDKPFIDDTPRFYEIDDPFVVRFKVKPLYWLDKEDSIPIYEDHVWETLSFTKDHVRGSSTWTGKFRSSLTLVDDQDGDFLEKLIASQNTKPVKYAVDEDEYRKFLDHRVRRENREVTVSVPIETREEASEAQGEKEEIRRSSSIQATLAYIGEGMGFNIWLPRNDRSTVQKEWEPEEGSLLDELPLNYDQVTLRTIEQIDVLWLKRRSIIRAFEVEHSTSIYSGILRMADLLALQPNMDIRLHIVAPSSRREKVFQELQRPVFSLLERAPLAEICSYLSYESIEEISSQKHLHHLSDSVLEEYEETAE